MPKTQITAVWRGNFFLFLIRRDMVASVRMDDFKLEGGELFKEGFRKLLR